MLFKDVINLVSITTETNNIGDSIEVQTSRQVFANKKSIRQSEFYQAQAQGIRPEITFVIRQIDYSQEHILEYENKQYRIIRTYNQNDEFIELICEGITNGVL